MDVKQSKELLSTKNEGAKTTECLVFWLENADLHQLSETLSETGTCTMGTLIVTS